MTRPPASWVTALACIVVLASCDDDPAAPTRIAETDAVVALSATTLPALDGVEFTIANGGAIFAPELAGQAVRLTFETSGPTPQATVVFSGGGQVVANVSFGSCTFVVAGSSFAATHTLGTGQQVTVDPCQLQVGIAAQPADGVPRSRSVSLRLANATSGGQRVSIAVRSDGAFSINGISAGTVSLVWIAV